MGAISSNTLFHFTSTADNIIKIIQDGFTPKFCLEKFGALLLISINAPHIEEAAPMTCFCDLPLSQIGEHLQFYGSYGIGLSKEWGKKNGLTPLTYIHENSTQIFYLKKLGSLMHQVFQKMGTENLPMEKNPGVLLFELAAFLKPYTGDMWRVAENRYVQKRFYDEREWRYVPLLDSKDTDYRLSKEEFLDNIKRAIANEKIPKKFALKFEYTDIKYLIVKKEEEMISLSDALDSLTNIYGEKAVKILKTKIISSEQILEDF